LIIINEKPLSQIEKEREEEKSPLNAMGEELALLKTENMQKDAVIKTLGQELALVKIELMKLKGGE
jgi:hypothetical protein